MAKWTYAACIAVAAVATHALLIWLGGRQWAVDGPLPLVAGCLLSSVLCLGAYAGRERAATVAARAVAAPVLTLLVVFMLVPLGFAVGLYDNQLG